MELRKVVRGPYALQRPRRVQGDAKPNDHERVVLHTEGSRRVLEPGELPTSGMSWFFRQSQGSYMIVDVGSRTDLIRARLASKDPGLHFECEIRATWHVSDPIEALEHADVNVSELVRRGLVHLLRRVSRTYGMETVAEFEESLDPGDLSAAASEALGFARITAARVTVDCDAEWEGARRTRALGEQRRQTERDEREAASRILKEEDGVTADAIARDPSFATMLAEDKRQHLAEDRQAQRESDRLSHAFERRMSELNARATIQVGNRNFQLQLVALQLRWHSRETEEWQRKDLFAELEALAETNDDHGLQIDEAKEPPGSRTLTTGRSDGSGEIGSSGLESGENGGSENDTDDAPARVDEPDASDPRDRSANTSDTKPAEQG